MAQVGAVPQAAVGLDCVQSLHLLQAVRLELRQQADAPTLLPHVQHYTLAGTLHLRHRLVELAAAVAQLALEDVARQATAVHAYQHRLRLHRHHAIDLDADAALAQRQVRLQVH